MTKPKTIKASLRLSKAAPGDVVAWANAVCNGLFTANDEYPHPPIDKPTLQGEIDSLSAAIVSATPGVRFRIISTKNALGPRLTFDVGAK